MSGPKSRCRPWRVALAAVALAAVASTAAQACGRDTDCVVGDRSYRIALPEDHDAAKPLGAIVFVHGYRGTAAGVMRNKALIALASDLDVALIAAQAAGIEWNLPGVPSVDAHEGVDELAYFDAVVADAARRFAIDPARVVVAGFSSGAMMVWHLACYRGSAFAGFVPMSGTFWEPIPRTCPGGAVNLIHYHGREDPIVPLHGRPIKDARQGDVFEAVRLMERVEGYRPAEIEQPDGLDCSRSVNGEGKLLELCLFTGKHQMKAKNLRRAWRLIAAANGG
jgi:polyhydroxybutyrate depolymerase